MIWWNFCDFLAARLPATAARPSRFRACILGISEHFRASWGITSGRHTVLTLEDAHPQDDRSAGEHRRMTDRGFLAVGMAADITVFDPATIIDHSTYEQPTLPSDGIRDVVVNGRIALRDGKVTGEQGGHVLSRAENMPSRRMRTQEARSLSVKAKNFTIDLTRPPAATRPTDPAAHSVSLTRKPTRKSE